jgi:hypothetical protein
MVYVGGVPRVFLGRCRPVSSNRTPLPARCCGGDDTFARENKALNNYSLAPISLTSRASRTSSVHVCPSLVNWTAWRITSRQFVRIWGGKVTIYSIAYLAKLAYNSS